MLNLKFSDITPVEYLATPVSIASNNDFSIALDDVCDYLTMTTTPRTEDMSETQYAALIMDEYQETPHGRHKLGAIKDIAERFAQSCTEAFDIIHRDIAPHVEMLTKKIDKEAEEYLERSLGYQNEDGSYNWKAPKFFLLDVQDLYTRYQSTAQDFAKHLCSRYHYNVEYLNDGNIVGLIKRINPVDRIDIEDKVLRAIMEDVVINIHSTPDGEVTIDTNQQDDVSVDGATPQVVKEDDQSSNSIEEEQKEEAKKEAESIEAESSDNGSNANVNVSTGNDNANISVTINDETVSTDKEKEAEVTEITADDVKDAEDSDKPIEENIEEKQEEKVNEEEKELLYQITRACFEPAAFTALRSSLFAEKGTVRHTHLKNTLFFVHRNIRDLIEDSASKYLSAVQMEMLRSNFTQMSELQMGGVMYLDISAVPFANKIIIGPNLLNKNLVNKALNEGVDVYKLIRNYLRVNHNTDKNDLYYDQMLHNEIIDGVAYDKLLSSSYIVEQKLIDAKQDTKAEYVRRINHSRSYAFKKVMSEYIRKMAESNTEATLKVPTNNKMAFVRDFDNQILFACNQLDQNKDTNVEDMIYHMFLSKWYHGTLVEKVYSYLSEQLRQQASHGQLTETSMAMVKAEVVATIGAEYIFKNFVNA